MNTLYMIYSIFILVCIPRKVGRLMRFCDSGVIHIWFDMKIYFTTWFFQFSLLFIHETSSSKNRKVRKLKSYLFPILIPLSKSNIMDKVGNFHNSFQYFTNIHQIYESVKVTDLILFSQFWIYILDVARAR